MIDNTNDIDPSLLQNEALSDSVENKETTIVNDKEKTINDVNDEEKSFAKEEEAINDAGKALEHAMETLDKEGEDQIEDESKEENVEEDENENEDEDGEINQVTFHFPCVHLIMTFANP